jgi:tetratricopeptide (TPR) repeat protein
MRTAVLENARPVPPLRRRALLAVAGLLALAGCNSEILEKQAQQLRAQEAEIERQRQEIDALLTAQNRQEQRQRDCNRAFREYFEKAQAEPDRTQAIELYREGVALCPDDDVAHYELGRALLDTGRSAEAEQAFEAALKINPAFMEARNQLEAIRESR